MVGACCGLLRSGLCVLWTLKRRALFVGESDDGEEPDGLFGADAGGDGHVAFAGVAVVIVDDGVEEEAASCGVLGYADGGEVDGGAVGGGAHGVVAGGLEGDAGLGVLGGAEDEGLAGAVAAMGESEFAVGFAAVADGELDVVALPDVEAGEGLDMAVVGDDGGDEEPAVADVEPELGAAGRGGEGHCARPGEHGGSAGPRAEGTPEREAQDCGDGQCPAGRAARDGENMGQRPLASHGKGGQEGAGP